jgi:hypothetical protein
MHAIVYSCIIIRLGMYIYIYNIMHAIVYSRY